jgi:2-polyprenyl-3-methyl-5-hydroxy-6-metoxy-1,4-benzoquinol methylase
MPNWSETAPVVDVACPLGCSDGVRRRIVDTVWEAPEAAVYMCSSCEIVFIHPIMSEDEEQSFYESDFAGYMKDRGAPGETEPAEHFEQNWADAERRAANLLPFLRPDQRVLEIGSATGGLLTAVQPHVASVMGVEPGKQYREYAVSRGIETTPSLEDVAQQSFDVVLAYYVVEHLRDPLGQVARLHDLLSAGGLLAIEVPNVEDALVRFYQVEAFDRFYWQRAHYFNYSHRTLADVLRRAGFDSVETIPEQRYDISNHVHWLARGKPGGKGKYVRIFDERVNEEYQRCLKEHWLCDTVFAVARRTETA